MLLNGGQVVTERAKISGRLEAWIDSDTGERLSFAEANARTNQLAHVLLSRRPGARRPSRRADGQYAAARRRLLRLRQGGLHLRCIELAPDGGGTRLPARGQRRFGRAVRRRTRAIVEPLCEQFPRIRWIDLDSREMHAALASAPAHEPPIGASLDDPLYMMYTSGTTGRPKGVENFNGWFQPQLFQRHFKRPSYLKRELQRLQEAVNTQHVHPRLAGLTAEQYRQ